MANYYLTLVYCYECYTTQYVTQELRKGVTEVCKIIAYSISVLVPSPKIFNICLSALITSTTNEMLLMTSRLILMGS